MSGKKVCEHCGELPAEHRLSLANLKGELLDTILICNPCYEDCAISKCVKSSIDPKGGAGVKTTSIVLSGGPYSIHVFTNDPEAVEYRFPAEPAKDLRGNPGICAPEPTTDGPVVYRNTGEQNLLGSPIFKFVEDET